MKNFSLYFKRVRESKYFVRLTDDCCNAIVSNEPVEHVFTSWLDAKDVLSVIEDFTHEKWEMQDPVTMICF